MGGVGGGLTAVGVMLGFTSREKSNHQEDSTSENAIPRETSEPSVLADHWTGLTRSQLSQICTASTTLDAPAPRPASAPHPSDWDGTWSSFIRRGSSHDAEYKIIAIPQYRLRKDCLRDVLMDFIPEIGEIEIVSKLRNK